MKTGRAFVAAAACAVAAFGFVPAHAAVTVAIVSPSPGWVGGTFDVSVEATSPAGITVVGLYVNAALAGTDTTAPYEFSVTRSHGSVLTLQARAVDGDGLVADSAPVGVTVDTVAPSASLTTGDGTTLLNLPSVAEGVGSDGVAGTSSDADSGVALIAVVFDHNTLDLTETGFATIDEDGTWTYVPAFALVPGEYTVIATPKDAAGNVGAADSVVVVVV